jgi:hypothetical protein
MYAQLLSRSLTGAQGVHPALELRDQLLLITAVVRVEHELGRRGVPVVRQVEEVPHVVEQRVFARSTERFFRTITSR